MGRGERMINERQEAEEILSGQNLDPYKMRHMCRLLTRYYYESGITDEKEIRKQIFSWANTYKLYIKLSLKHLISEELDIYRPVSKGEPVYVSKEEINAIMQLSRKKTVRKAMLGMLCYAKMFAIDNVIDINIKDFCEWICCSSVSNFYNYALKEMLKINFLRDVETDYAKWQNGYITKCTRKLYINFGIQNDYGEYVLDNDNFSDFFKTIYYEIIL